jgi:hypothetical protein
LLDALRKFRKALQRVAARFVPTTTNAFCERAEQALRAIVGDFFWKTGSGAYGARLLAQTGSPMPISFVSAIKTQKFPKQKMGPANKSNNSRKRTQISAKIIQ